MLSFEQFCVEILKTGDIDPDYLFYKNMTQDFTEQVLFDLIHIKLCVYKTESELLIKFHGKGFDDVKYGAERNKSKRTAEKTYLNIKALHKKMPYEQFKMKTNGLSYRTFNKFVKQANGIGDWASWKYADILNQVLGFKIQFSANDFILGYEYPLKGLLLVSGKPENVSLYKDIGEFKKDVNSLEKRLSAIQGKYVDMFDPTCAAEYETLLCKYHSYVHGHYKPQEDITKLRKIGENKFLVDFHKYLP